MIIQVHITLQCQAKLLRWRVLQPIVARIRQKYTIICHFQREKKLKFAWMVFTLSLLTPQNAAVFEWFLLKTIKISHLSLGWKRLPISGLMCILLSYCNVEPDEIYRQQIDETWLCWPMSWADDKHRYPRLAGQWLSLRAPPIRPIRWLEPST